MTEYRPYRSGLGLPEVAIIKSDPTPSTRQRQLFEEANAALSEYNNDKRDGLVRPNQIWKEWNINPVNHGPEHLIKLPTFVPSSNAYDELGRSMGDGVGVEIDIGKRGNKGKDKELMGGEEMSDWYKTISGRNTRTNTPLQEGPEAGPSTATRGPEFNELKPEQSFLVVKSDLVESNPATITKSPSPGKPVRIHRKEWFIRRALANQATKSSSPDHSSTSRTQSSSSISALLNIPPQTRVTIPRYFLGPDNKGYEILRDRLGWEGGGLGRPKDWESSPVPVPDPTETAETPRKGGEKDMERSRIKLDPKIKYNSDNKIELDENGNAVVDLTVDSDSNSEPDVPSTNERKRSKETIPYQLDNLEDIEVTPGPSGPGRTTPISTTLKLDRRGLGHSRRSHTAVTHSAEDIRKAQMRSKYPPPKHGIELGKKGKIKWKEKDKNEREERRRLLSVLNG